MDFIRQFGSRLGGLLRRRSQEAEMAEEMRQHMERRTEEKIASGLAPEAARVAVQREFGGLVQIQEQCRDERRFLWLEQVAQDMRYALRQLRRNPGFAMTAIATLALGIGFNTAIFSVAYGVLWRPLPYPEANRLATFSFSQPSEKGLRIFSTWAPKSFEELRSRFTALEQLAAYSSTSVSFTGRGEPRQLAALEVSPNFFPTLRVEAARGRLFLIDARTEDDRSVIISDRFWRTFLQADPEIIGQTVTVGGVARTVIGVLPRAFSFRPMIRDGALPEADLFLANRWPNDGSESAFLSLLGRLKPTVTPERAAAELTMLVKEPGIVPVNARAQAGVFARDARTIAHVTGLQEQRAAPTRGLLLILLGAVSVVQLIACFNVATLQIARLSARQGELSVRMALGAGRSRVIRQLLTEAVILSSFGAMLAVVVAHLAVRITLPLVPSSVLPGLGEVVVDGRVMAFCLGLSLVSTLLIGVIPVTRLGGSALGAGLATGAARVAGDRQGERARTVLVAAQIAMTLVLLVGAGLLAHSFLRLTSVSTGFESVGQDGVVQTVKVTLPETLFDKPERAHAFERSILERIQRLPGVKSASVVNSAPFGRMFIRDEFSIEGEPKSTLDAGRPKIEEDYFKTMGIRLIAGREFTAQDTAEALKVAIVSERIVRECIPGGPQAALGRRVRLGDKGEWLTVVGVVADIRQMGLDREVQPMIYAPFRQERGFLVRFVAFVARTTVPASVGEGIRAEIRRAAPDLPIDSSATMDESIAASVAAPRFRMVLLGMFAITATLIAICGIYGLMSYAVTQRRREFGVRMALGAQRADVIRLVLARAIRVVGIGLVAGIAGSAVVARVLQRFLFGVTPGDPVVFVCVTLLLLVVALLAAGLPARRATKVDPLIALRSE